MIKEQHQNTKGPVSTWTLMAMMRLADSQTFGIMRPNDCQALSIISLHTLKYQTNEP